jgi:WD40 repeat protein
VRQAAMLLVQVARAVHYAHQRGVLHRDLKPSNILIDADGRPHLTDFGLAKILEQEIGVTRTAEVMGTPSYMSPEQAAGHQLTTATDLWSLGAIFYELLTGQPPFRAENTPALLRKISEDEPAPPGRFTNGDLRFACSSQPLSSDDETLIDRKSNIINSVDRDLETICLKCLEKDQSRRYASADALADDLERWLSDEPILARRATSFERVTKWARRQPLLAAAVLLLHLVFITGVSGVFWQWRRAEGHADLEGRHRQRAEAATRRAEQTLRQMEAVELRRAEELYEAEDQRNMLSYLALILRQNPTNRIAAERLFSSLSHRSWARLACPPLMHSNRVTFAMFSRDGMRVVTSSADNTACVWDTTSGQRVAGPFNHAAEINIAVFSPVGDLVVTASKDKTARVWDAHTGASLTDPLPHDADVSTAQFSPNGELVLTTSENVVQFWSVITGQRVGVEIRGNNYVTSAQFSPDGLRVAVAGKGGQVQIWDVTSGVCLQRLVHAAEVGSVSFSPNGKLLVTASEDMTARVWDVETGQANCPPLLHLAMIGHAEFSLDGQRIVTASHDRSAQVWDALTGQKIGPPLEHNGEVRSAAFSPEGLRIATSSWDKTVRVWDALTGDPLIEPILLDARAYGAGFHPDGQRLLTVSNGKAVMIWDTSPAAPLTFHLGARSEARSAAFSPDGISVVVGTDRANTRVWDVLTGKALVALGPGSFCADCADNDVEFSPDCRFVAVASDAGAVTLFNSQTGEPLTPARLLHDNAVTLVRFRCGRSGRPTDTPPVTIARDPHRPPRPQRLGSVSRPRVWRPVLGAVEHRRGRMTGPVG